MIAPSETALVCLVILFAVALLGILVHSFEDTSKDWTPELKTTPQTHRQIPVLVELVEFWNNPDWGNSTSMRDGAEPFWMRAPKGNHLAGFGRTTPQLYFYQAASRPLIYYKVMQ